MPVRRPMRRLRSAPFPEAINERGNAKSCRSPKRTACFLYRLFRSVCLSCRPCEAGAYETVREPEREARAAPQRTQRCCRNRMCDGTPCCDSHMRWGYEASADQMPESPAEERPPFDCGVPSHFPWRSRETKTDRFPRFSGVSSQRTRRRNPPRHRSPDNTPGCSGVPVRRNQSYHRE